MSRLKCKIMLFNKNRCLNVSVSEIRGMKCRLYSLKDCNAYSGFGFRYGGERTFCFIFCKLAFFPALCTSFHIALPLPKLLSIYDPPFSATEESMKNDR